MTEIIVVRGYGRYTAKIGERQTPPGTWGIRLDMQNAARASAKRAPSEQASGSVALAGMEVEPPMQQPNEAQQS